MAEFFYRETEGDSRRLVGPFDSEDEARKAARYKGIRHIEVLKKNGVNYDAVGKDAPGAAARTG
jgi:hypothetical protein